MKKASIFILIGSLSILQVNAQTAPPKSYEELRQESVQQIQQGLQQTTEKPPAEQKTEVVPVRPVPVAPPPKPWEVQNPWQQKPQANPWEPAKPQPKIQIETNPAATTNQTTGGTIESDRDETQPQGVQRSIPMANPSIPVRERNQTRQPPQQPNPNIYMPSNTMKPDEPPATNIYR